jgi:hypothetical protein
MNVIFLIGNGFDLNLGLKTKYSDFYEYYKKVISTSKSINELKDEITGDLKNWSDLELALGKYTENLKSVAEFDEVFEDIGEKLSDYLHKEENSYDFTKLDRKKMFDSLSYPEKHLLQADLERLNNFKKAWKNSQWNIRIITFNYTRTIEKILGDKLSNISIGTHNNTNIMLLGVEHIHGYTNDRMVMGVNDVSQISNNSFHRNQDVIEALVKINCNQAYKHTLEEICRQQISSANLICIFGSSIGETDKMWWEIIGKRLTQDCQLIIFDRGENISTRIGYKKARLERNIRESFQKISKMSEDEKKLTTNKIYVGINTSIFDVLKDNS